MRGRCRRGRRTWPICSGVRHEFCARQASRPDAHQSRRWDGLQLESRDGAPDDVQLVVPPAGHGRALRTLRDQREPHRVQSAEHRRRVVPLRAECAEHPRPQLARFGSLLVSHGDWWTLSAGGLPFEPAPREFHGQMCGIHVAGLPLLPGCRDATLVLTWLLPGYAFADQARIIEAYRAQGYVDFLLDWAYARSVGYGVSQFVSLCARLKLAGCRPVPMLSSKDFDPHHDVLGILAN